jgi:N,N'-diacetylchitobiose transport system substrate-binding protein
VLEDLFVGIANGGDVQQLAEDADAKITEQLN